MEQVEGSCPRGQICVGNAEIKTGLNPEGEEIRKGEIFVRFEGSKRVRRRWRLGEKKLKAMEALVSSQFF